MQIVLKKSGTRNPSRAGSPGAGDPRHDDPLLPRFTVNLFGGWNPVIEVEPLETPAVRRP